MINVHRQREHGLGEVDAARIGKPGSRSQALEAVWHDGDRWQDAWVECRHCDAGFRRYLIDVDQPAPSARIWRLVEHHFATRHADLDPITRSQVGTRTHPNPTQRAFYWPLYPDGGASITCRACQAIGYNPIVLTDPPYGDARRLRLLANRHPDLLRRIGEWRSSDQAAYLDALDRGLLDQPDASQARAVLSRAATTSETSRPSLLRDALRQIMHTRIAAGERVKHVIDDLADTATYDPRAFACLIGEEFLRRGILRERPASDDEFADAVRRALDLRIGQLPTISTRTLYRLRKADAE